MGMPTERLLRMVESNDTRMHFIASPRLVEDVMTRSMMGLPYFVSPVWKKGVSAPASMKLPSAKVRNSRGFSPLIWPPMMNEALNGWGLSAMEAASRRSTSRTASETMTATSNIVRAFQMLLACPSGASPRCLSTEMTDCVPARFPELSSTITRSPGRSNTVILQKVAKLSTPACVRESEASTMPSFRRMPTQYVMGQYVTDLPPATSRYDPATLMNRECFGRLAHPAPLLVSSRHLAGHRHGGARRLDRECRAAHHCPGTRCIGGHIHLDHQCLPAGDHRAVAAAGRTG